MLSHERTGSESPSTSLRSNCILQRSNLRPFEALNTPNNPGSPVSIAFSDRFRQRSGSTASRTIEALPYTPTITTNGASRSARADSVLTKPPGIVRYLAESKRTRWKVKRAAQKHRSPNDLHKQFLPSADISQLVGRRAVCLELFKATNKVSGIRNPESYEKILAILYLMKQPELLTVFVDNGACDAHLPFDYQEIKEDDRRLVLRSRNAPNPRTVHLSEEANVREFAALQWCVLAHVFALPFEMDVPHYQLGESVILPFKKLRRVSYGGCSGTVYKAKIHPDYHSWNEVSAPNSSNIISKSGSQKKRCNVFAIKVLHSGEPAIFPQEIRILEKFQKESHHHKHIVDLLATFEQYGMYHLVFPWAKFNLFQYWEDHPSPEKSVDAADWLMKQCHGLVEALHNIHRYKTRSGGILLQMSTETQDSNRANTLDDNDGPQLNKWFFGRHGDLKPENILWYPIEGSRYGILKIADFGSTRFSEEKTKYGIVPNSMTYQSPEFNLRGRFGIACDIWALGCVYLLFATWYFGGMKAIDKFGKDRLQPDKTLDMNVDMFFTLDDSEQPPKAFVKLAVQKKILDLRALLANSPKIRVQFTALINLLENDMLVVNHEDEDRNPTEDTMKGFSEYRTGIRLEHSLSPSSQSRTRKSCGHVMRALGDYCRPSGEQTRQSTFNTP